MARITKSFSLPKEEAKRLDEFAAENRWSKSSALAFILEKFFLALKTEKKKRGDGE